MASSTCGRASFATVKQSMSNPEHRRLVVDAQTAAIAFAEAMTRLAYFEDQRASFCQRSGLPAQHAFADRDLSRGALSFQSNAARVTADLVPAAVRTVRAPLAQPDFDALTARWRLAFTPSASICLRPAGGVRGALLVFRVVLHDCGRRLFVF